MHLEQHVQLDAQSCQGFGGRELAHLHVIGGSALVVRSAQ
jgi:hypothetical protein